jgi:hypothetical protein
LKLPANTLNFINCELKYWMKNETHPLHRVGWEMSMADPYPHDSGHMRQHGAPALEGQNM